MKLAMIWQWRANKGLNYAEDLANYEDALASLIGADKGSNILTMGTQRMPADWEYAFPGSIIP
ncbi:MAG: hypothetical protein EOO07_25790 [Chitinophagaceae bacterium]|nr:MAG: hypothetical protein EOO07_25790 [Chitinophagaceae bacterium]